MAKKPALSQRKSPADQLFKQLAAAPVVEILGVLDASGVGGGWSQGDTRWTLSFSFAAWRIAGGPLRKQELVVRRKVWEKEIEKYQKLVKPDVVNRIRARVVEKPGDWPGPQALLEKVLGREKKDAELNAEIERLQQPVKLKDKQFGTFTLDRRVNWFEGKTTWNGRKVRLSLSADEPGDVEKSLEAARKLWRAQPSWQAKVLAYAVKKLLPLKNDNWLDDDQQPLSAAQFQKRMKLESITVGPDGSFEFWHDDGDLFYGHSIQISGSFAKGLFDADIPG